MASRVFYTGTLVSEIVMQDMISRLADTEEQAQEMESSYRQHMTSGMEKLDDRLWWEPETSQVYWEDDGSGKELPEREDFEVWWDDATQEWIDNL